MHHSHAHESVTAIGIQDDDTFVCAEDLGNFYTLQRNTEAVQEHEKQHLLTKGAFHTGGKEWF